MKLPFRPPRKKKLQATTAAARRAREADFTEEPNVKLSSAFIVVLVLHIVAVGGIYAFNAIKAHQPSSYEDADSPPASTQAASTTAGAATMQAADPLATTEATPAAPITYRVKSGDTIARIAAACGTTAPAIISLNNLHQASGGIHVGQLLMLPPGASPVDGTQSTQSAPPQPDVMHPAALRDSGNTYTVVHGDTPVSIAHKLHVGYDELIRLNKIDDPRKLRIGMKLKVPARHPAA